MEIAYNSETYDLENPNECMTIVMQNGTMYKSVGVTDKKPIIELKYDNLSIVSNNIHHVYVILQFVMKKSTLIDLSKQYWDYSKWSINISSIKKDLPDWAKILKCILNLSNYNQVINIQELEDLVKLNDKRGWCGERPREIFYKFGFPLYTPRTKKYLKNGERLIECPFPICKINPNRKAIVMKSLKEVKCFTCGLKEGEMSIFGNVCHFEKGHFDPHILGGTEKAAHQCKWCNSFYKDKITWNEETGKPIFNSYAILRDAPKNEIIEHLKQLGFNPEDLK